MEEESKIKSFRYSKMTRKNTGETALLALFICAILYLFGAGEGLLGTFVGLIFWISGIIWMIQTIKLKMSIRKVKTPKV